MQIKWMKLALACTMGLAVIACGGEEQQAADDHEHGPDTHEHHDGEEHDHTHEEEAHLHEGGHDSAAPLPAAVVGQLTTQYLAVKDALVAGDAEAATAAAKALFVENADGSPTLDHLLLHWQAMAEAGDLEAQRVAFEDVSEHMYLIAKANPGESALYKQYCPMAFDNTGAYWLAAEEEVLNPYFGDAMLRCGKVQETIGG